MPDDLAILDQETLPRGHGKQALEHFIDLERCRHLAIGICDEIEGKLLFSLEFFLILGLVEGDAEHLHALLAEVCEGIAQGASLLGATDCARQAFLV